MKNLQETNLQPYTIDGVIQSVSFISLLDDEENESKDKDKDEDEDEKGDGAIIPSKAF